MQRHECKTAFCSADSLRNSVYCFQCFKAKGGASPPSTAPVNRETGLARQRGYRYRGRDRLMSIASGMLASWAFTEAAKKSYPGQKEESSDEAVVMDSQLMEGPGITEVFLGMMMQKKSGEQDG